MEIIDYIKTQTGLSVRALAKEIGVAQTTLARQLRQDNALTLETLRDISLATGLDFLDLAIRAELITEKHANEIRGRGALNLASDEAILDELRERLARGANLNEYPPIFDPVPAPIPLHERRKTWRDNLPTPDDMAYHIGAPTPDGTEFRPDLYQNHKMLWDRHGKEWKNHYALAANKIIDGDDIKEPWS